MNYLDVDSLRRVHTPPPTSPRPVIIPVSSPSISLFFFFLDGDDRSWRRSRGQGVMGGQERRNGGDGGRKEETR